MTPFAVDPVIGHAAAAAVAIVFLVGAWHKFADLHAFRFAVERYRLLPEWASRVLALALPPVEAVAGLLLLLPATRGTGAVVAAALVCFVTAAVVVNLLRGHVDIDCGCGVAGDRQRLSWVLVVRNAALLGVCALAGAPEAARALVWLDAFTAIFATLALWAVWAAAGELLSDARRFSSAVPASQSRTTPLA